MIRLTLYNNSEVVVNADLIEFIEHTPDTLVSLTTGQKLMVKESVEDVVRKVLNYRRLLLKDRRFHRRHIAPLRITGLVQGDELLNSAFAPEHSGHFEPNSRGSGAKTKGEDNWTSRLS